MKTWNFNLTTATDVDIFDTLVGYVVFYELTSGGGADARIRCKSLGGGIDVELVSGQGYKLATPVRGLVIENLSGVAIAGKLAIAPDGSNFENNRQAGQFSLDAPTITALVTGNRPEAANGSLVHTAALTANTAINFFLPGSNTAGAILLSADIAEFDVSLGQGGFLAKNGAPATVVDGEPLLMTRGIGAYATTNHYSGNSLSKELFIPAGLGLYFIRTVGLAAATGNFRSARWKLL